MENQELDLQIKKADALYADAKLGAALEAYRQILDIDDNVAWAHSRVGAILAQMKDLEGAEQSLLRAIELDPLLPQAHSNLGNIYYARGDFEAALAKYKDAVALNPDNPTFHENLHAAYKKLGKLSEAVSSIKRAHRLERTQSRAEAKVRMATMKENMKKGRGCLGSTLLLLALTTATIGLLIAM